ncbi:protein of unknown function [Streptococcus thermophilus]|nr:protein of unknown function [Streptococcus thermophilus]CAD0132766.1 protein of unknown function [Streptococcus thermophilus]CAD0168995.1 protein of unknown function [Streptococcus thermophilus]
MRWELFLGIFQKLNYFFIYYFRYYIPYKAYLLHFSYREQEKLM